MFSNKKKIEFNNEELRITLVALNNFRSSFLGQVEMTDPIEEVLCKLKSKMKIDRYEHGLIVNGLYQYYKELQEQDKNLSIVGELITRLLEVGKSFK